MQKTPIKSPVVYDTKPATEWLSGGPVQKVSPRYAHALFQRLVAEQLGRWVEAGERGRVGTEWRFWIASPDGSLRYLVPDVAYLSYERIPAHDAAAAEEPRLAPDAVFEIRSKDDRNRYVAEKIAVYLAAGTGVVCVVDPYSRRLVAHDAEEMQILGAADTFTHRLLPEFELPLAELFERLDAGR